MTKRKPYNNIAMGAYLVFVVVINELCTFNPDEVPLGKGFTYFGSPSHISYWNMDDSTIVFIPPNVLSYITIGNYIIVKQQPDQYDSALDPKFYVYPLGRDTVYYWFIDKHTKETSGPMLYSDLKLLLREKHQEILLQSLN